MGTHHLYSLLQKYRRHQCTPDELAELEKWYEQFNDEAGKAERIPEEKLGYLYQQIQQEMHRKQKVKMLRKVVGAMTSVAAVLLLIIWGSGYFTHPSIKEQEMESIVPGRYQAELIMSDGTRMTLDASTVVTERNGVLIKKETEAALDYSQSGAAQISGMNTIRVPRGGEYHIILSDGSRVWLNSESSLQYPVVFGKDKREVKLSGEGYFEVAKSVTPFIVKAGDLDVRVMGTSFNISTYEADETVTTTLVTGLVEVSGVHVPHSYQVTPGHKLTYAKSTTDVFIEPCDTEIYTSWIKGEFKFRDMRLEEIMVKLNRWYNCTVTYADPALKELRFSGAAEKDRPVGYLLGMIEMITEVHFEIVGNKIIVMHK